MARMSSAELRRYAAIGVQAEISRLHALFPQATVPTPADTPVARRRKLSAAAKKRISVRMKESWARKKAARKGAKK